MSGIQDNFEILQAQIEALNVAFRVLIITAAIEREQRDGKNTRDFIATLHSLTSGQVPKINSTDGADIEAFRSKVDAAVDALFSGIV